ncbi:PREDICTED: uncharacterized protein LOC108783396 [Cyphomyrmex costatus]|uniref:uncharacterized protein LOC108783396 n=1 Tax=Cyphomyrmex costatus TaxID=456900 RepID=UPI00085238C3|nr:PREDICTED: uncharacterized protein LOC108783396 [Cyphomyrmex costatus]
MDLRNDIKKATSLTFLDNNAKFYRLQEPSQATKDRKMNERSVKKPRNAHLLEESDAEDDDINVNICNRVKSTFDEHEVSAAVREVNGGRDLSNRHWEENFFRNLEKMIQCEKDISQNSSKCDNIKVNQSEVNHLNNNCKQKVKLYRNAAIMGLVRIKKISLDDLISFNNENSIRKEDEPETANGATFSEYIMDSDKYHVESVPLREDPEIYVHPLQMGIDVNQFKDIDFSVPRIGKKITVTPAEHFFGANDDAAFSFVQL